MKFAIVAFLVLVNSTFISAEILNCNWDVMLRNGNQINSDSQIRKSSLSFEVNSETIAESGQVEHCLLGKNVVEESSQFQGRTCVSLSLAEGGKSWLSKVLYFKPGSLNYTLNFTPVGNQQIRQMLLSVGRTSKVYVVNLSCSVKK